MPQRGARASERAAVVSSRAASSLCRFDTSIRNAKAINPASAMQLQQMQAKLIDFNSQELARITGKGFVIDEYV